MPLLTRSTESRPGSLRNNWEMCIFALGTNPKGGQGCGLGGTSDRSASSFSGSVPEGVGWARGRGWLRSSATVPAMHDSRPGSHRGAWWLSWIDCEDEEGSGIRSHSLSRRQSHSDIHRHTDTDTHISTSRHALPQTQAQAHTQTSTPTLVNTDTCLHTVNTQWPHSSTSFMLSRRFGSDLRHRLAQPLLSLPTIIPQ